MQTQAPPCSPRNMVRFSAALFVSALLFVSSAFGNEIQQIAAPMTHLVLSDKLYTTIHTNVQRLKGAHFSGKVVGKFEKMGGGRWYHGSFRGTKSANESNATFGYKVGGTCKSMGFDVKFGGKVNGKMSAHGTWARVYAAYEESARGTLHGQTVKGSVKGNAVFTAEHKKFFYRERGTIRMSVGGKLITAKYFATLDKKAVRAVVYGMYGGKKFFMKYSLSLNLVPLGLDINPITIKRNYGTVYLTVGGKTYKILHQKCRLRGMVLLCSSRNLNLIMNVSVNVATMRLKTYSTCFYRGSKYTCLNSSTTLSAQENARAFNTSISSLNQYQKSKVNSSVYKNVADETQNGTTISPGITRRRGVSYSIGNIVAATISGICTIIGAVIAAVGACRRRQLQQP